MNPIGGYLRNVTININATNSNVSIHASVVPSCQISANGFDVVNGGPVVAPNAAQGGYITSPTNPTEYWHVSLYSPLAIGIARHGASTTGILNSMGVEFLSDDGTADTIFSSTPKQAESASSTQYIGFAGYISTTEAAEAMPMPIAGTLKNLMFANTASPTIAAPVTVDKNGSATTITATIGAGDTATGQYADTTHTVSVVAGDYIDVSVVSGASTPPNLEAVNLLFVPGDGTSAIIHGTWNSVTTSATAKYSQPFSLITGTTEANAEYTSPIACSASHLYVYQVGANGGTTVTTFTLYHNGAASVLSGTIGVGVTGSTAVDTTHSVSIAAGDSFSLQAVTNTGTSGAMSGWSAQCN
jgi:hypothetical protein